MGSFGRVGVFSRQILTFSGQTTTRSSPSLAMSPFIDSANSQSVLIACLTSSMLLLASGVMRRIMMFPDFTSFFMFSKSDKSRRGMAFK